MASVRKHHSKGQGTEDWRGLDLEPGRRLWGSAEHAWQVPSFLWVSALQALDHSFKALILSEPHSLGPDYLWDSGAPELEL